jgi:hypothetical protein
MGWYVSSGSAAIPSSFKGSLWVVNRICDKPRGSDVGYAFEGRLRP